MTEPHAGASVDKEALAAGLSQELQNLVTFWVEKVVDSTGPGFHGEVDANGDVTSGADRGAILCARLLWFLAEAALHSGDTAVAEAADQVYDYSVSGFKDETSGGFHWMLQADSSVASDRKQTFAQAFFIYAFSSYYRLRNEQAILDEAIAVLELVEAHASSELGPHVAAFDGTWEPLDHMGLDDLDAPFTFDTELHVLEAYAALYRINPTDELSQHLRRCLDVLDRYYLDRQTWSMHSDLDEQGAPLSRVVLFGHAVESAWLIWDAVTALDDPKLAAHWRPIVLTLIHRSVSAGLLADGRLIEGYERATGALMESSVWWMQAEMLVALLVADRLEPGAGHLKTFERVWDHVGAQHVDPEQGEWLANARDEGEPGTLVNQWKGPYHNGRALLRALQYLNDAQ